MQASGKFTQRNMSEDLKQEYLNKHLPYRINSLLAHDLILHRKKLASYTDIKDRCYGDSLTLEPAFEISPIFGRSLLNFLGLGLNSLNNIDRKLPRGTDFTIKDLFPERDFCPIDDPIIIKNNLQLSTLITVADKSVAHLTSVTVQQDHDKLPDARKAIYALILKYVPEINKNKIWWYTQVDNNI